MCLSVGLETGNELMIGGIVERVRHSRDFIGQETAINLIVPKNPKNSLFSCERDCQVEAVGMQHPPPPLPLLLGMLNSSLTLTVPETSDRWR